MRIKAITFVVILLIIIRLNAQQTITDIDGNRYETIKIGEQIWMKENLKTTRYNNGDSIRTTNPDTLDISNETSPKYQWAYNGNENHVKVYGRLYTWYAITDSRKVCPCGWHVPTMKEWKKLFDYIGKGIIAADKLKEAGTIHWNKPNANATNESGFTALPAGSRWLTGDYAQLGESGHYWSSDELRQGIAFRVLFRHDNNIEKQFGAAYAKNGWSVRCIRN
jgi:uncharacterized protein (TIGR02145 family)